ncbi:MAG: UDP-N-acetylmuramoyl-tripeptide--D-alanyl-D-alanine ligase [Coriobacteriales bacterium]|jgi:UDP-N-acetylmuramoyl-tripeptide--D-alanyl-D-alanine ligase|nr:UDP-N-acetylmuramoyl-tripeptide--D-alanyl-D-alanine ligase [Coriobacteriales bacterium]
MKLTIEQVITHADSRLLVPPPDTHAVLRALTWDSRRVIPGSLFVGIVGEQANGNSYIVEAIEAGAALVIASEDPSPAALDAAASHGVALLQARDNDVMSALQKLARAWRSELGSTVVGITGSSGKTTTKDLIAGVVSARFNTHATLGNRNSELGLAETILNATELHELIVCEMGMQAQGEIAMLCQAAQPHIGVVTNVGVAHCELLGSRENIARAKAELLESLPDTTGIAILPGDDPYTPSLRAFAQLDERGLSIISYGLGEQNDIRATHIEYDDLGHPSFDIWTPDGSCYPVRLQLQGEHNVLNALAAVAVGLRVGVPIASIIEAVATVKPAALRQEMLRTAQGELILNDTYNANPDSMRAALSLLKRLATSGKRVAVLGDMYELGPEEARYHRQIGEYAFVNGVDELVTVGSLGAEIAAGALAVGMPAERVHRCSDVAEALEALSTLRQPGEVSQEPEQDVPLRQTQDSPSPHESSSPEDSWAYSSVILVKASRGMQLERIARGLVAEAENPA